MSSQYLTTLKVNGKDCKLFIDGKTVYYDLGYGKKTLRGVYYKEEKNILVDSDGNRLTNFDIAGKILS